MFQDVFVGLVFDNQNIKIYVIRLILKSSSLDVKGNSETQTAPNTVDYDNVSKNTKLLTTVYYVSFMLYMMLTSFAFNE